MLVAEADPERRSIIRLALARALRGAVIECASDAGAIIASARSHPPGVVLLDVDAPEVRALDVVRVLRAEPATCDVPVVLVGTTDAVRGTEIATRIGAQAFMRAPYDPAALIALIRSLGQF